VKRGWLRGLHHAAMGAGLELEAPWPLAVPSRWCGQGHGSLHPSGKTCPQACQGSAHQSSKSWTRSSKRTVVCLELLNSGQKQRKGSPRRALLQNEAHEPGKEHVDKGMQSYASAPKPPAKPHKNPVNPYR